MLALALPWPSPAPSAGASARSTATSSTAPGPSAAPRAAPSPRRATSPSSSWARRSTRPWWRSRSDMSTCRDVAGELAVLPPVTHPHLRALSRLGLRAGGPRVSARHLRAAGTLVAGLALLAVVAWQSGAKAVHYASDPTHEPCPALTPGDHTLTIDTAQGRRQVLLHAPRGAYKPRPLVIALHGAGQTATEFANSTGFSRLADREDFLVAYSPSGARATPGTPRRSTSSRPPPASTPPASSSPACRTAADRRRGWRAICPGASRAWRRWPAAIGRCGRARPSARCRCSRSTAPPTRSSPTAARPSRLQGQREAVAGAVAAHRRLPRERSTG